MERIKHGDLKWIYKRRTLKERKAAKKEKPITENKTEREREYNTNDENAERNSFVLG